MLVVVLMSNTDALEWYSLGDFFLLITELVITFCPITLITSSLSYPS
jgi:hypothetical protein